MAVVRIQPPGKAVADLVTPIDPELVFSQGLSGDAVAGTLKQLSNMESDIGRIRPESFAPNSLFLDLLHAFIAERAPAVRDYQLQAQQQHDRPMYIIDGRASGETEVIAPADIFGVFVVRGGVIQRDSYRRNHQHSLFTEQGFFRLHDVLKDHFMRELLARQPGG
jgi:hypothetical protein